MPGVDRFTDDAATEADGVLRTVDNDVGRGLPMLDLSGRGFEFDEAVLERPIAAKSLSDVPGDDTLECAVGCTYRSSSQSHPRRWP